jgi:hypothetical protein
MGWVDARGIQMTEGRNGIGEAETDHEQPVVAGRPANFPFSEWQLGVEEAVVTLSGHVRHATRNAFVHLQKAWQLHGVDDAMSGFRAITAEEEAATALMLALKQRRYPGADRLRHRDHAHKSAVWSVITAVNGALFKSGIPTPQVHLSKAPPPRVLLRINVTAMAGGSGEPVWAEPDEPLNFSLRSGKADDAIIHLFEKELAELADVHGQGSIRKHVEAEANLRNRLLYAGTDGLPHVEFEDAFLLERARRVGVLCTLVVIVMQTPIHQLFLIQCLEALLQALGRIEGELTDYKAAVAAASGPDLPRFSIVRVEGAPAVMSVTRRIRCTVRWLRPPTWLPYRLVSVSAATNDAAPVTL